MKVKIKGVVYLSTILLFICSPFFILIYSQSSNIFSNRLNPFFRNALNTTFMESFGFFTRDPKEKQLSLYELDAQYKLNKINLRTNSASNLYGLSRKYRVKTIELGKIQQKIPDSLWMSIRSDSLFLKDFKMNKSFKINKSDDIRFVSRGCYVICNYKIVPWEWNKHLKNYEINYAFIEIN